MILQLGGQAAGKQIVGLIAALLMPAYLLNIYNHWASIAPITPGWVGVLALISIWGFYTLITGKLSMWNVVCGVDGRASTSKFQAFVWTGAVVYAYVTVVAAHGLPSVDASGATNGLPSIHPNVLAALGISLGTTVGAAVVTASATNSGDVVKVHQDNLGMAPIFTDDAGNPDLGKIQLVTFTLVAVAVFLGQVLQSLGTAATTASLPDIDPTLAALTGIGSAVYLGGKLATTATPYLGALDKVRVSLAAADADRTVTVVGANLGTDPLQVEPYLDGEIVPAAGVVFTPATGTLAFVVPQTKADGTAWILPGAPSRTVDVTVAAGGRRTNARQLTLLP